MLPIAEPGIGGTKSKQKSIWRALKILGILGMNRKKLVSEVSKKAVVTSR